MNDRKPRLGRGLDALLGAVSEVKESPRDEDRLKELPVDLIQRGKYQPRSQMNQEALEELADSIRAQGVVQPIVVRPVDASRYEIIAGERRWRAAQMAGLHQVPVIVKDIPDEAAIAVALIENIQREDLNPVEEAVGLQRLIDEFGLTHQQVAETVGRSRTAVTNLLRLLSLNHVARDLLENGDIDMGHARCLLPLDESLQVDLAREVARKGMSVRQTEAKARQLLQTNNENSERKPASSARSADIISLEQSISEKLGAKVKLDHKKSGKGRLIIEYHSNDELEGIMEKFH